MRTSQVNLSISADKLAKLIQAGDICAADFRCLDSDSKQIVWQLCLLCCSQRVGCLKPCSQSCSQSINFSSKPDSITSIEQVDEITSSVNKITNII
ncbi:hypothetical protein HWQ46_00395 [Shewanella sp. D64]|nr:hypothetical protein [Shewanella sp. MTB7]MEC4724011.1 hypothetical protein [Shewanella sp. D64]MEC4736031.1 hypothetical protein [Shewanella sp. E94]WBJ98023.1 hypothetical protein HWQ47_13460 [Shewanella sp. MTB7]